MELVNSKRGIDVNLLIYKLFIFKNFYHSMIIFVENTKKINGQKSTSNEFSNKFIIFLIINDLFF
jgi:hypothetical protein